MRRTKTCTALRVPHPSTRRPKFHPSRPNHIHLLTATLCLGVAGRGGRVSLRLPSEKAVWSAFVPPPSLGTKHGFLQTLPPATQRPSDPTLQRVWVGVDGMGLASLANGMRPYHAHAALFLMIAVWSLEPGLRQCDVRVESIESIGVYRVRRVRRVRLLTPPSFIIRPQLRV